MRLSFPVVPIDQTVCVVDVREILRDQEFHEPERKLLFSVPDEYRGLRALVRTDRVKFR
jgi:hypothetical protein